MKDLKHFAGSGLNAACLSLAWLLLIVSVGAQTGQGTITGTVRDRANAVIPGAEVTLTQTATNIVRKEVTRADGVYYFGSLPIGKYDLDVVVTGFRPVKSELLVQVGQQTLLDVVLEVGAMTDTISVTAAAPLTPTETAEVSDIKDYDRIRQLPLNGRSVSTLFDLTPGIEGGGNARVNGLKVGSLEITLDGVSLVDRYGGGIARVQPGLDIVQEFRVETVGSDARYSRPATVILATRSGTNEFHGSAFETHRNNAAGLLARRRETTGSFNPPKLIRNEFGISAGGPLFVPRLGEGGKPYLDGRNKTFWFVAYEGLRSRQSLLTNASTPTAAMWNGNLSLPVDANGNRLTVYDPLTTDDDANRLPFANYTIPANRISPFAKVLQSLTAPPTNNINPYLGGNLQRLYPQRGDTNNLTVKGDQRFSAGDMLSVRWTRSFASGVTEGGVYGYPIRAEVGLGTERSDANINNVSITETHTFSPALVNELLMGLHRSYKSSGTLADFTDWPGRLGLPNPFGAQGWPTITIAGDQFGWDAGNRKDEALTGGVLENNVTWIKGAHTIQFGGKYRREWNNVAEFQQAQGSHTFDGSWTSLYDFDTGDPAPFSGNSFADLLLGLPNFLSNQYNRGFFYFRQTEKGLYFTDRWKATPRLTLTLGLRWDNWTPYREKYNRLVTADIQSIAANKFEVITPGNHAIQTLPGIPPSVLESWAKRGLKYTTAEAVGYPSNLFRPDYNNFGPRVGVAFKLDNKTVLRGGYGEYFWPMPLSQLLQSARINPPLNLRFVTDYYAKGRNYTFWNLPAADDYVGAAKVNTQGLVTIPNRPIGIMVWDGRNWKDGRAQSWHVSIERELPWQLALRASYIGELGRDLEQRFSLNPEEGNYNYVKRTNSAPLTPDRYRANANWNVAYSANRTGYSNLHGGQLELERRFMNGVALQWFYVFSSAFTTTDADGFTDGSTSINAAGGGGQVPENVQLCLPFFTETQGCSVPNLSYDERLRLVYFRSTNIPTHRIRYNAIVDLPFGRGKKFGGAVPGFVNQIIGGWQVAGIGDWRSGLRMSADSKLFQFGDLRLAEDERVEMTIFGARQRLWFRGDFNPALATNVTGGNLQALIAPNRGQRLARPLGAGFNNQLTLTQGGKSFTVRIDDLYNYSPRANLVGPGAWNADLSLFKNFSFREHGKLRVAGDFFNAFNHPVDVSPNPTTGLQDLSQQANSPRTIQLSLRVEW